MQSAPLTFRAPRPSLQASDTSGASRDLASPRPTERERGVTLVGCPRSSGTGAAHGEIPTGIRKQHHAEIDDTEIGKSHGTSRMDGGS